MNKRQLGKTGFEVSEVGLGCWQLGGDFGPISAQQSYDILTQANQQGINFWDTADVYGDGKSESLIADWHQQQSNGIKPIIATKVGRSARLFPDKFSKQQMLFDIQASAKRLAVETIDLVQLHCIPPHLLKDGEVFTWLQDFKQQGIIQHYGASVETIAEGMDCLADDGLASLQIIFNLFRQDAMEELLPLAEKQQVGIIVRLPLASGLLTGKFGADYQFAESDHRHYNRDGQAFSVGETFAGIALNTGVELVNKLRTLLPESANMASLALRWILDHPQVSTVIAGASKAEQVRLNCLANQLPSLTPEYHQQLSTFYLNEVKQHIRCPI